MTPADSGGLPPGVLAAIDRVIAVHRPVVLAHIRGIRRRRPQATPAEVLRTLERRYLAAVTTGGAAVGATAMIPAVGTVTALALSGAETIGFLEATALYAQSVTEVHGIALDDPERARALVLALIVGGPGQDLVRQFAGQATGAGPARTAFWGELITKNLPRTVVAQLADQIRRVYLPKLIVTETGSVIGRILPFGIGAVVGGVGNQLLGRMIVRAARTGFGPPPAAWPAELALVVRTPRPPRSTKIRPTTISKGRKPKSATTSTRNSASKPTAPRASNPAAAPPKAAPTKTPPPPPPAPDTRRSGPPPT